MELLGAEEVLPCGLRKLAQLPWSLAHAALPVFLRRPVPATMVSSLNSQLAAALCVVLVAVLPAGTVAFELCGGACGSNMVLQRAPAQARLWATTASVPGGSHVNVTLDLKPVAFTIASEDGSWEVLLPPQEAGVGHTISVVSSEHGKMTVDLVNVAFGDVYLCSGGSDTPPVTLAPLPAFPAFCMLPERSSCSQSVLRQSPWVRRPVQHGLPGGGGPKCVGV